MESSTEIAENPVEKASETGLEGRFSGLFRSLTKEVCNLYK
jgi:hypothetical protein